MEIMLCYQIESKPKASKMTNLACDCEICRRIRFFHVLSHFLSVTSAFSLYPCVDRLEFQNSNHVVLFRQWALRTTCMVTISNPGLRPWHIYRFEFQNNHIFLSPRQWALKTTCVVTISCLWPMTVGRSCPRTTRTTTQIEPCVSGWSKPRPTTASGLIFTTRPYSRRMATAWIPWR